MIRDVAGLRPFRPSGFRLETQQMGGKIIVHNYGHGGGGVTLSWGTAELAVEEIQPAGHQQYAVLGAGAVGLATARLLQQRGAQVTIYAKDLPPHTTSNIAGALFRPGTGFDPERVAPAFFDRFERAMRISHRHFEAMIGDRYGIRRLDNYFLGDEPLVDAEILVDARVSDRIRDLYPQAAELAPRPASVSSPVRQSPSEPAHRAADLFARLDGGFSARRRNRDGSRIRIDRCRARASRASDHELHRARREGLVPG